MWRIEGVCVSVTRGLQGRQRQEFELMGLITDVGQF